MRKHLLPWILPLLLICSSVTAYAGDFVDTRISFTLGDDNFFKNAGQQTPESPKFGIGDHEGYEFPFDNLDQATTGRENELHLVLYKRVDGILPGLVTEVAAAMQIDMAALEGATTDRIFADDSSYIRLIYAIDAARKGDRYLDLVLFPLSGDRFRVGYLYDLTWGGTNMFRRKKGPTPTFKLGGNHGRFYWWAGMKMLLSETTPKPTDDEQGTTSEVSEYETLYSVMGGVGAQPVDGLSIDLSGGHLQMAHNPWIPGELVTATGLSARVAYGQGLKVGLSSDLLLVRNDPEYLESLSQRPQYNPGGGVSWRVALEGNAIAQVLGDIDLQDATKRQWAGAAALDLRLQYDYLRVNVTGVYRSLQFSLLSAPGFPSYFAFPKAAIVQPEMFAAVSADYHIPWLALTPGIQAGMDLPGAMKAEFYSKNSGSSAPATLVGQQTLLVRSTGELVLLPRDEDRLASFSARISARWYPSDILTLMVFMLVTYDPNDSVLTSNPDQTKSREFQDPWRLGAGVTAQARF